MSEEVKTIRGEFPNGIGKPKLDRVFADAEKWIERDEDKDGWTVAWRFFVRHPHYSECTMLVEATTLEVQGPGVRRMKITREISDNGRTPVSAISQIARYGFGLVEFVQRRKGGPIPTPEEDRIKAVKGWRKVEGDVRQEDYCHYIGVSPRQMRRWERELEEQGKL